MIKLRAIQFPKQETLIKIENSSNENNMSHMIILYEHGTASIRDYVLIEIMVEILQNSLNEYFQSFRCNQINQQGIQNNVLINANPMNSTSSYSS